MRFAFTPDQMLSRDALRELLREHCSASQLRAAFASEDGRVPGLWAKLSELGVVGALAPEAAGGLGLSFEDLAILLEETGRAAVPDLVVETAAVAVPLWFKLKSHEATPVNVAAAVGAPVAASSIGTVINEVPAVMTPAVTTPRTSRESMRC